MSHPAAELRDGVKYTREGRALLSGASFAVQPGERVHICCPRREVRDMLAALLGGLERLDGGEAIVLGQPLQALDSRALDGFRNRHIGWVSPSPGFLERMTMVENIAVPLALRGMGLTDRDRAALDILGKLDMEYGAWAYPGSLSAGELRLAALCRAMITEPEILLLNDALAGLNGREARRFAAAVNKLLAAGRQTLLFFSGGYEREIRTERSIMLNSRRIETL